MSKAITTLLLLVILPLSVYGGNILIWNYDPLDEFYDGEAGATVDCAYWLEQTITNNGHTYETVSSLPADLTGYDAVFVTLGWYRC